MGVSSKMPRVHQALCLLVSMRERDSNLFHFGGDIQKFPVAWYPQKYHRNNRPLHFPPSGTPVLYWGMWSTLYYPISDISSVYHQPDITACSVGDTGDLGSNPGWGWSPGRGKWQTTPVFFLKKPMDRGAWRATVQLQRVGHSWATTHDCVSFLLWSQIFWLINTDRA